MRKGSPFSQSGLLVLDNDDDDDNNNNNNNNNNNTDFKCLFLGKFKDTGKKINNQNN